MTDPEALTHAIQEINRHYWCSGGSRKHAPAIEILARLRTEAHIREAKASRVTP